MIMTLAVGCAGPRDTVFPGRFSRRRFIRPASHDLALAARARDRDHRRTDHRFRAEARACQCHKLISAEDHSILSSLPVSQ
jgi:hypothetical protein